MLNVLENYMQALKMKYLSEITVKWIWAVVTTIITLATIGYAAYCIYLGGSFTGGIKWGSPSTFEVTFNCAMP